MFSAEPVPEPAAKKAKAASGEAVPTAADVREVAGAAKDTSSQEIVISEERYKHFMKLLYKLCQEKYQVSFILFHKVGFLFVAKNLQSQKMGGKSTSHAPSFSTSSR